MGFRKDQARNAALRHTSGPNPPAIPENLIRLTVGKAADYQGQRFFGHVPGQTHPEAEPGEAIAGPNCAVRHSDRLPGGIVKIGVSPANSSDYADFELGAGKGKI